MAYTVTASGTFSASYGYFTINGTKYYAAGTWTFDSKPAITIKTSANGGASYAGNCKITVNGETVSTGSNTYTLETDDDTIDIVFTEGTYSSRKYYSAAVTTSQSDPMAPKDSHNTNVGSVAYQIESGTVRFGGAAYEIESGMTLVNGVAYEIPLAKKMYTASLNLGSAVVTINGTEYTGSGSSGTFTLELPEGTVLSITTKAGKSAAVKLNNITVATGNTSAGAKYDYVLKANVAMVQRIGGVIIEITES